MTAITSKKEKLVESLKKYFNNLKFSKEDFERIKKVWIANEIKSIDNISATSNDILTDIIDLGEYKNEKIKDIESLDYEELTSLTKRINFKKLEKENKLSIIVISPKN